MSRWNEKLNDFNKALNRLNESIIESKNNPVSSTLKDGVMQRFEFACGICWKVIKYYLESEGIEEAKSPKSTFREAFKIGLIDDGEKWIDMLKDRRLTLHAYDEEVAVEIYNKIVTIYYNQMLEICNILNLKDVNEDVWD